MRQLLVFVFALFGLLAVGILTSALPYLRSNRDEAQESRLWAASIAFWLLCLVSFAVGTSVTPDAIKANSIIFTLANTFFMGSVVAQTLFCRALLKPASYKLLICAPIFVVLLGGYYEYLRGTGDFIGRVIEVAVVISALYFLQLIYLVNSLTLNSSVQIRLLLAFTFIELLLVILRLIFVATQSDPVLTLDDIPLALIAILCGNLLFPALSYLTMGGYWAESSTASQVRIEAESGRVRDLLNEREALLRSVLMLNRSATAGVLSASIAHELNQPIGAHKINLFTLKKFLADKNLNDPDLNDPLLRMEADNERIAEIIKSLRSIFLHEHNDLETTGLREALEAVISLSRKQCLENGILVHTSLIHAEVIGRQVELQQVFLNLINNAIHALELVDGSNRTKEIWVSASKLEASNFIRVYVEDNGPGIALDRAPTLFKLFNTNKKDGLGIGLWLSHQILSRTGARIAFSPRLGGGSSFEILIPLKRDGLIS